MKLICLPYAGGNAQVYSKWKKLLKNEIDVISVEYAGHGSRYGETFTDTYLSTVEDIFEQIKYHTNEEYAIYGHSMGAIYVYELAKLITKRNLRKPVNIIVSAAEAPYIGNKKQIHNLPQNKFIKKIYNLGGMTEEVIKNKELVDIVYPILLNDFRNMEKYREEHKNDIIEKINIPITVMYGSTDKEFGYEEAKRWQDYTSLAFSVHEFIGGHFGIFDNTEVVCEFFKNLLLYY